MLEEKNTINYMSADKVPDYIIPVGSKGLEAFDIAMKEEFNRIMTEEKKKVTIDPRKQKIKDLKNQIKLEESAITELLGSLDVKAESELPEEEQKKRKEEFGADFTKRKALISSLREELKQTRLNKYSSSFFSFVPHVGMNRRTARNFRRTQK
jgi:hypothetical protein